MSEASGAQSVTDAPSRILAIWKAMAQGDLGPLERALAPDARWCSFHEDAEGCHGRGQMIGMMKRGLAGGLSGRIEEATALGPCVIVGFRPERRLVLGFDPSSPPEQRPLDQGLAYVVVTLREGLVAELKGCVDRAAAVAYAQAASAG